MLFCTKNGRHQLNNFNLTRKLHENGWLRMTYNNKVQGGPLTVINGAITPMNGLKNYR